MRFGEQRPDQVFGVLHLTCAVAWFSGMLRTYARWSLLPRFDAPRARAREPRQDGRVDWKGMAAELFAARGRAVRVMRVTRFSARLDRHVPTTARAEVDRRAQSGTRVPAARAALGDVAIGPLTEPSDRSR